MINNNFEDTNTAIVDIKLNEVFYYIFSSHAHIIAENTDNYRYATPSEHVLLMLSSQNKLSLGPIAIDDESLIDEETRISTGYTYSDELTIKLYDYSCNNCKEDYTVSLFPHYCPKCGIKYKKTIGEY